MNHRVALCKQHNNTSVDRERVKVSCESDLKHAATKTVFMPEYRRQADHLGCNITPAVNDKHRTCVSWLSPVYDGPLHH